MPRRYQFYEPIVQAAGAEPPPVELPPIRGLPVEAPGMYLLAQDVTAMLRRMAETFPGDDERAALLLAAQLIDESVGIDFQAPLGPPPPDLAPESNMELGYPEPQHEPAPGVARIEIFPNEDGNYWFARPVDDGGNIIRQPPVEGIRRDQVEHDACLRWPGVEVYELPDAMGDSLWDEQHSLVAFNGRRRPSHRRLFQG